MEINKNLISNYVIKGNNDFYPLKSILLEIFDIKGNLIAELISKIHSPGQYSILWNASSVAAGLYFVEMKAYSNNTQLIFKEINKMLYLK